MKKFLSLALALVMTFSLVTISAGAKDFADDEAITYEEAVDVMSAVKVIDGYEDGSFNPTATLTRGAAAKIICNLILGPTTAAALSADTAPYSDVPTNHTFAGYIAYCAKAGIISGYADGTFRPAATLTSYAFMKMLLGALGYDAEVEGYTGSNWSINVAKRALNIGLDDGLVNDFVGTKAVTREEACLFALNTLKATMVEYDSTIIVGDVTIAGSAAKEVANSATTETIKNDDKMQFAEKYFSNLKMIEGDTDVFKRPATTWKVKNSTVGTYADTPDLSYTKAVKLGTLYTDLGLSKGIEKAKVTVITDGGAASAHGYDLVKGDIDATHGFGGNGTLTDIYYDADAGTVLVIMVKTYVAEVAAAYAATTTKDAYVVLDSTVNTHVGGETFEADGFAKEDIVLFTYSNKAGDVGVQSMAKAEAVTGELTAYTTNKNITAGGTKYDKSATCNTITGISAAMNEDVTVYLDEYGYAIYVDADTDAQYAAILAYVDGDTLDPARAKLLFTDGTVKTVELKATLTTGTSAGNVIGSGSSFVLDNTNDDVFSKYDIVSYVVDSNGKYTLTVAADSVASKPEGTTLVTKGVSTLNAASGNAFNVNDGGLLYANGKTIFLIVDETTSPVSYKVYEGISQVPTIAITGGAAHTVQVAQYTDDRTIADIVVIQKDARVSVSSDNKDVFFMKGDSTGETYVPSLNYYEFTAYKQGEESQLKIDATKVAEVDEWTLLAGPAYNDKGVVIGYAEYVNSSNTTSANMFYTTGTVAEKNGVVGLGATYSGNTLTSATYYAYADDCKVYFIGTDGTLTESVASAITNDADNKVWVKMTDGLVTSIYVKVIDAPETITPGATATLGAKLVKAGSSVKLQIANNTGAAVTYTGTVTITNTNSGVVTTVDLAGASVADNSMTYTDSEVIAAASDSAVKYQATVTIGNVVLTTNSVIGG